MSQAGIAVVFPGQGAQSVGMLAGLSDVFPSIKQSFEEASEGAGVDLWALSQQGPEQQLNRTEYTQPALLAAGIAVWRVWQAQGGAAPAYFSGHSLGEYTALVAAGALSLKDGAHLVRIRGQLMQEAAPEGTGAMAAVLGAEDSVIEEACKQSSCTQVVVPANFNSPGQIVIGGDADAVDRAIAWLNANGVRKTVKLPVSVPSHTPLMREAANRLSETLRGLSWQMPSTPVVRNVDASISDSVEAIQDALVRQLYMPVQWTQCVEALVGNGTSRFVECGPGKVLSGLIKRIHKEADARAVGTPEELNSAIEAWNA